jgi:hypothetical protein
MNGATCSISCEFIRKRFCSPDLHSRTECSGLFVRPPQTQPAPLCLGSPRLGHLQFPFPAISPARPPPAGPCAIRLQAFWKRLLRPIVDFVARLTLLVLRQRLDERFRDGLFASFPKVLLLDSTSTTLPDAFAGLYPGRGNQKHHGSLFQRKLQCVISLRTCSFQHLSVSGFNRKNQSASPDILPLAGPGDLVIRDLGYFAGIAVWTAPSIWVTSAFPNVSSPFRSHPPFRPLADAMSTRTHGPIPAGNGSFSPPGLFWSPTSPPRPGPSRTPARPTACAGPSKWSSKHGPPS